MADGNITDAQRLRWYANMLKTSEAELREAATKLGMKPQSIAVRVNNGFCRSCALTQPRNPSKKCPECEAARAAMPPKGRKPRADVGRARQREARAMGYAAQDATSLALGGSPSMVGVRLNTGWCIRCAYTLRKGELRDCKGACSLAPWRKFGNRTKARRSQALGGGVDLVAKRRSLGWCLGCAETVPKGGNRQRDCQTCAQERKRKGLEKPMLAKHIQAQTRAQNVALRNAKARQKQKGDFPRHLAGKSPPS